MPGKSRNAVSETPTALPSLVTTKQHFGKHLSHVLRSKGLTQSDLAAMMWGRKEDKKRGVIVAINRDLISSYINGRAFPNRETLTLMATKLDMEIADLVPRTVAIAQDAAQSPISIIVPRDRSDVALFEWREELPLEFASMLAAIRAYFKKLGRVPTWKELAKL